MSISKNAPTCPYCGALGVVAYKKQDNFEILPGLKDTAAMLRCLSCKSLFLNYRPSRAELIGVYDRYFTYPEKATPATYETYTSKIRLAQKQLHGRARRMLEIGSAGGHWTRAALQLGWEVDVNDLNEAELESLPDLRRGRIYRGFFEDVEFDRGAYDLVLAMNLFEHILDPEVFVRKVWSILRHGGVLMMKTPHARSWSERLEGIHWRALLGVGHVQFGTRASVRSLFEGAGFEIALYQNAGLPPGMEVLNRLRPTRAAKSDGGLEAHRKKNTGELRYVTGPTARRIANTQWAKPIYFAVTRIIEIGDSGYWIFRKSNKHGNRP